MLISLVNPVQSIVMYIYWCNLYAYI